MALYGLNVDIDSVVNRTLALVLWATDENGEDDVVVFPGTLSVKDGAYYLIRESGTSPEIREEWFSRISEVSDDIRDSVCNCDFVLSLSVGDANDNHANFDSFGLEWPS